MDPRTRLDRRVLVLLRFGGLHVSLVREDLQIEQAQNNNQGPSEKDEPRNN